jgi:cephalosporin hydroxylase
MRLVIDDIYSPEGHNTLIEACTKALWAKSVNHRVTWFGIPTIQTAEDLIMMADLVWRTKPDLIVECGVCSGGGLAFYASLLELLGSGEVIGVDVNPCRPCD